MKATILVYASIGELLPLIKSSIESHLEDQVIRTTSNESTLLGYLSEAVCSYLIVVNGSPSLQKQLGESVPGQKVCFLTISSVEHPGILQYRFQQDLLPDLIKFYIYIQTVQERRCMGQKLYQRALLGEEKRYQLPSTPDLVDFWVPQLLNRLTLDYNINSEVMAALELSLREALNNAIIHGNFELSSEIRDQEGGLGAFLKMIRARQEHTVFRKRMVSILLSIIPGEIKIVIEDEGKGFSYNKLQSGLQQPAETYGRGIRLMQYYMDHVEWNDRGNIVTLVKRY